MTITRRIALAGLTGAATGPLFAQSSVAAEEVYVLAADATRRPVQFLIGLFEKHNEGRIKVVFDSVDALKKRVLDGDNPDVVVISDVAIRELAEKGRLARRQHASIGRTAVAICQPRDAAEIDITTADKMKAALLAAPAIVYVDPATGASSGQHVRKVLSDLGILDQVASKSSLVAKESDVPARVAKGEAAIGICQSTEIVVVEEVRYRGSLPDPHALLTNYSLGSVKGLRIPASQAAEFAVLLISELGQSIFEKYGFVP